MQGLRYANYLPQLPAGSLLLLAYQPSTRDIASRPPLCARPDLIRRPRHHLLKKKITSKLMGALDFYTQNCRLSISTKSCYYLGGSMRCQLPIHRKDLIIAERKRQSKIHSGTRRTLEASPCYRDFERITRY